MAPPASWGEPVYSVWPVLSSNHVRIDISLFVLSSPYSYLLSSEYSNISPPVQGIVGMALLLPIRCEVTLVSLIKANHSTAYCSLKSLPYPDLLVGKLVPYQCLLLGCAGCNTRGS